MGAGPSKNWVSNTLRRLARKYPGVQFRAIHASNGECAVLPVNPATGQVELTDPQNFMPKPTQEVQ